MHILLVPVAERLPDFPERLRPIRAEVQNHKPDDLRAVGPGN